jgi:drug/metabolite transporter (DMT)-like permease
MLWFIFASLGALISTSSKIIIKFLFNKKKYSFNELTSLIFIGTSISSFLLFLLLKPANLSKIKNETIILGITAGLLIPLITLTLNKSLNLVSNLALTGVIFAVGVTISLLLASVYFFNVKVKKNVIIGILIALLGVSIIMINK